MKWWYIPFIAASISVTIAAMKSDHKLTDLKSYYKRLIITFLWTFAIATAVMFLACIFLPSSQSGGTMGYEDLNILMQEVDVGDPGF